MEKKKEEDQEQQKIMEFVRSKFEKIAWIIYLFIREKSGGYAVKKKDIPKIWDLYTSLGETLFTMKDDAIILDVSSRFVSTLTSPKAEIQSIAQGITELESNLGGSLEGVSSGTALVYQMTKLGAQAQAQATIILRNMEAISIEAKKNGADIVEMVDEDLTAIQAKQDKGIIELQKMTDEIIKSAPTYLGGAISGNPKLRSIVVHIDSTHRDVSIDRSPAQYSVNLTSITGSYGTIKNVGTIKEIAQISLIATEFPNLAATRLLGRYSPRYVFLVIDEFSKHSYTTTINGICPFAKIQIPQNDDDTIVFLTEKYMSMNPLGFSDFTSSPLAQLAKLTISWYDGDGQLIDLGTDRHAISSSIFGATTTTITTATNHQLVVNDRIYIRGCDIVGLNRDQGFIVKEVNSSTVFVIDYTTTVGITTGFIINGALQHSFTLKFDVVIS
jgi:hypothetical protein